jgi:HEAT repeat protein
MAFWAGGFKDRAALPSLLKLFGDDAGNTPQGRTDAIHAMGALRSDALSPEEQNQILRATEQGMKDPAPSVRYYAVWGIQRTDGALAPAVEPLLNDLNPRVRAIAQEKLYQLRLSGPAKPDTAQAPEGLRAGLSDPSPRARAQAVRAFWLGGYKDPAAVNPLLDVFADKSDENRIARLDALRALAFLRATPLPGEMKNRIVGAILLGLKDPYFAVRYQAAKAITPADAVALPVLREAEKDEYPLVQGAAKEAIERLGKK